MNDIGELFEFCSGESVTLGKGEYTIIRKLRRRADKDKLLIVSYYARQDRYDGKPVSRLCFIKTSTYCKNQPTEFCRHELDAHHQKFRRMAEMIPLFRRVEGAAPEIYDIGVFEPSTNGDPNHLDRHGIKLDYLISELVGDVDLKLYLTGADGAIREAVAIDTLAGLPPEDAIRQHFPSGGSISETIQKDYWRPHEVGPELFKGLKPPKWYKFADALTKNLKRLHNHGLVHGQLSPYTVRLKLDKDGGWQPVFVDFEESQQLASAGTNEKADKADETVDITGLGQILLYLACGREWHEVRTDGKKAAGARHLPRLSKTELQDLITKVVCAPINDKSTRTAALGDDIHLLGIAKIIDKCLREGGGDRDHEQDQYLCCEDIAEELAIFGALATGSDPQNANFPTRNDLLKHSVRAKLDTKISEALLEQLQQVQESGNKVLDLACGAKRPTFFHAIWTSKLEQLGSSLEAMSRNHYEVHGDREELIDHLTRSLAGLQSGDIYLTLTRPSYWSQQNLGSHGRFLSVNQIVAVQKKVHTIRLFMLKHNELDFPGVRKVLEYHRRFHTTLKTRGGFQTELGRPQNLAGATLQSIIDAAGKMGPPIYYTGVSVDNATVSPRDSQLRTTSKHVALILSRAAGTCVSISFHDHLRPHETSASENLGEAGGARRIHKVRFTLTPWNGTELQFEEEFANEFVRNMDFHLRHAVDVMAVGGGKDKTVEVTERALAAPTDTRSYAGWNEVAID